MTAVDAAPLLTGDARRVARVDDMARGDWLDLRRRGIGGSDAAAVCGLDPWRSPFEVWLDKTGTYVDDDAAGEAMRWGQLLEPVIADELATPTRHVLPVPYLLAHRDLDWQLANVDRVAVELPGEGPDDVGVVEIKTTSMWQANEWRDRVPLGPMCQAMHCLSVTGHRWALVAALIGGQRLVVHRVERDEDLIGDLLAIEAVFWAAVETKTPPEPDGSKSTTRLLARLYDADPDAVATVARGEVEHLVAAVVQAKARERAAAQDRAAGENALKVLMGDATLLVDGDGDPVARWPEIIAQRINHDRLRAEYPDVAAAVTEADRYRRFTLTGRR